MTTVAMEPALELAILMAVRVRGRLDAPAAARAVGCSPADATRALARLEERALVVPAAAPGGGTGSAALVTLADAGRAVLATALAAESFDRAALAGLYERFLVVDRTLKEAVTTWQLADPASATQAQAAVMAVAATAGGVAAALGQVAARFAPYAGRITTAAAAIATGDARFVASPRVDSLHQVWFELHEDLLVTLGRSRAP